MRNHPTSETTDQIWRDRTYRTGDRFYSVQLFSAPHKPGIRVAKMYDDSCLAGIGWVSLLEFTSRKSASIAARYFRDMLREGAGEDRVMADAGDWSANYQSIKGREG